LVKNARAEGHPVLVVDSGDLFFGAPRTPPDLKQALAKARLIARAYEYMGAVAVTVGERDLLHGLEFLRQVAGQGPPLISANLANPLQKQLIFHPYVIQEVAGVRIAFFGLTSPPQPPSAKEVEGKVIAENPMEAARKVVGDLKGKADLIILLSDLAWDQDIRVAQACPGIDFILGGPEGRATQWPYQEGETFIFQSYQKGMYAGKLTLTLETPGFPFQDEGKVERIQGQLNEIERRIIALQRAEATHPSQSLDSAIKRLDQQRHNLQEELQQVRKVSSTGNRFRWTLEPLSTSLPEDGEVLKWIKAAGITSD
jgi:2',3'-cyclic-nucleotide 2'-phosphodiesterase (5'-nucleotidase family)